MPAKGPSATQRYRTNIRRQLAHPCLVGVPRAHEPCAAAADEGAALNAALDEGVDPAKSADKGEPKRVYAKKEYVSDEAAVKKGSLKRGGVKGVVTPNQGEL